MKAWTALAVVIAMAMPAAADPIGKMSIDDVSRRANSALMDIATKRGWGYAGIERAEKPFLACVGIRRASHPDHEIDAVLKHCEGAIK